MARLPGRGVLKASVSLRGAPWRSRSFFFQEPATASRSPASSAPAVVSLPRPADNPDRAPPVPAHQKNNNRPAAADPTGRTSLTRMRREAIAPPHRRGYLTTTSAGGASARGASTGGASPSDANASGATTRPLSGWAARSRRGAQSSAPHRPRSRRRREALRTRESQSKTRVDPYFAPTFSSEALRIAFRFCYSLTRHREHGSKLERKRKIIFSPGLPGAGRTGGAKSRAPARAYKSHNCKLLYQPPFRSFLGRPQNARPNLKAR